MPWFISPFQPHIDCLRASTIRITKAAILAWIQTTVGQSQQKDLRKKVAQKVDKKLNIKVDKNLGNKVGRKVYMRPEKGRETMALTGLRRNGITRRAY